MRAREFPTLLVLALSLTAPAAADEPLSVGSALQLLADPAPIERVSGGARLVLQHPTPREVSLTFDEPWEGNACHYVTVFQDGPLYRMYYRGADTQYTEKTVRKTHREVACYAESRDGVRWTRPALGLFDFNGSKANNIVWDGEGTHDFTPFRDTNPAAPASARYKAFGRVDGKKGLGLVAFTSPDGIHWTKVSETPVITRGVFDSQNLAFWDASRGEYRAYVRDFRDGRDIRTCTSKDFEHWTDPVFLEYEPGRTSELYTNQILPYPRAPHLFVGFPARYWDRGRTKATDALPRPEYRRVRGARSPREGTAVTDTMFMTSRDGLKFRVWPESCVRPGPHASDSWFYGDSYQNWGLVETASAFDDGPPELSVYVMERTMQDRPARLRRHTLRLDGFVSANAPLSGGEVVTRPLRFSGSKLLLNLSTSAAGSARVEVQDADGKPLPGFTLADAQEAYGDAVELPVYWKDGADLKALAGKPVRLRFVLKDADLFAFQSAD
ncbi:MAG: hypothetical protein U0835_21875 [Isosphaeraceae bacterium]